MALCADRYGVPDRQTAALVSAALQDVSNGDPDPSAVIDRSKIRRERSTLRSDMVSGAFHRLQQNEMRGLFFDGRSVL